MPTVTRNTLWFDGLDGPYVDFEVKGTLIFFNFKKSLTYCVPDGRKKALWPGGPAAARDDGVDLSVKEWSFWLIADDGIEMSCSYSGAFGPELGFYNMERGINVTQLITETEAKHIKKAVETMIEIASGQDEEFPLDESIHVLKPSNKVISYPVKAYRWTAGRRYPVGHSRTPVWNPTVEGY
jgi:hypothetical protein